jgi:hypothetical protein
MNTIAMDDNRTFCDVLDIAFIAKTPAHMSVYFTEAILTVRNASLAVVVPR